MSVLTRTDWPQIIPILLLAVVCMLVLAVGDHYSRDRIAAIQRAAQLHLITEVMPLPHDNDLLSDTVTISDKTMFVSTARVTIYRARRNGQPAGLVFLPVPARGYNGVIELAVGVAWTGELTGVRVHALRETPGLGDQVHQDRGDWILGFDGRSLLNTPQDDWDVRSDGGQFDQISGATITPRGIIKAVKQTLDYYALHRDELFK